MLTKREIEIFSLRREGLTQKEIAKKLKLSQPAISKFENNIKKKTNDSLETINILRKMGVKIET